VGEEYIEEEPDTPIMLPDVVKDAGKVPGENSSQQESPHVNNKRSRVSSSNKQPHANQSNMQYNS